MLGLKDQEKSSAPLTSQTPIQAHMDHGIKAHMAPPKETNNTPVTDHKGIVIFNLLVKELE